MGKFVIYPWEEGEEHLFRGHLFVSGWVELESVIDKGGREEKQLFSQASYFKNSFGNLV